MTTTKTTHVAISTTNNIGSAALAYLDSTKQRTGNVVIRWQGSALTFASIADYELFVSQIVLPLTDTIHGPTGIGFIASTAGTASDLKVID